MILQERPEQRNTFNRDDAHDIHVRVLECRGTERN